jgi:hypothetical protein
MPATKFLDGLSNNLAQRWFSTLFTPAFLFWAGGLITKLGWESLQGQIAQFSDPAQIPCLGLGLGVITLSAAIVQRCEFTVLRFLEGYWHPWLRPFQQYWLRQQQRQQLQLQQRWQQLNNLQNKLRPSGDRLTPEQQATFNRLDIQLMGYPAQTDQLMPTRLGNLLRASELRPQEKYGLDTIICWPRLWLVLPESTQRELTEARNELNTTVRIWFWGVLFWVWARWDVVLWPRWNDLVLTPWDLCPPLISLGVTLFAYRWMLYAAEVYGDLLEATFDLYRFALYRSLHWPLPPNPAAEKSCGAQLTAYLWRGSDADEPEFTHASIQPTRANTDRSENGYWGQLRKLFVKPFTGTHL